MPEAPPPPDLVVAEASPPEALIAPPPAELPPPPADTMLPPLPPRRDPLPDLPRPRTKPQPPQLARATPEATVAPPRQTPLRTEVASVPAVVPPQPVAIAPSGDALAQYGGKLYEAINATARKNYPRQSLTRGEEGTVPVRLVVDSDGILVSIEVLDDDAAPRRLVKAAVAAVESAAPFPAFAGDMGAEPAAFEVRILYKLR